MKSVIDFEKKASFEEAFFHSDETYIHPTAVVGSQVTLEPGVKIGPYTTITGNVHIGSGTRIYPYVSIGFPAQNLGTLDSLGAVVIGKYCEIREFASIHASKYAEGKTTIGDYCYVMNYAHVSHDATLEHHVTLINNVQLGGHTHVGHHAIIMAYAATHQFCRIGAYTALAPYSGIRQDLPPFCLFNGQPASFAGLNLIGLRRAGFSRTALDGLKTTTKLFYHEKKPLSELEALAQHINEQAVWDFVSFVQASVRGVSRRVVHQSEE